VRAADIQLNERPVLTIKMDVHHRFGIEPNAYSGATADVFDVNGKAYKVFRVYGVARLPEQVKTLFESECEAYKRAAADAWLRHHTAAFYGSCAFEDIVDIEGNSVGDQYALDCSYGIELLFGSEGKLYADGLQTFAHLQEARRRFRMKGIDVRDSSVFNYENAQEFKLIDFRLG
jgi:hypothetical protein